MADLVSGVWGNRSYPITQPFGVHGGALADWYGYSSSYGWPAGYHIGVDVGLPKRTNLYAANAGTVIRSGFSDSFRPSPVWIEEDQTGNVAIYGHMWENAVSTGQRVRKGQFIGKSGEQTYPGSWNPDGSGPHIHFEYRVPDERYPGAYRAVDPVPVLRGTSSSIPGGNGGTLPDIPFDFPNLPEGLKRVGIGIAGAAILVVGLRGLGVRIPAMTPIGILRQQAKKATGG